MYNNCGRDCRDLPEISQQRQIYQTERFLTKNALIVWQHIHVWEYIFYDEACQI